MPHVDEVAMSKHFNYTSEVNVSLERQKHRASCSAKNRARQLSSCRYFGSMKSVFYHAKLNADGAFNRELVPTRSFYRPLVMLLQVDIAGNECGGISQVK